MFQSPRKLGFGLQESPTPKTQGPAAAVSLKTGNGLWFFLIADVKDILQPSFGFSMKVLKAHQKIYKAMEARDAENSRREMFQHLSEVEKDLALLQKQKRIRGHVLSMGHGFGLEKEVVSTKGIKRSKAREVMFLGN